MNSPATDLIRRRFSCRRHPERAIQDETKHKLQACLNELKIGPFGAAVRFLLLTATERDRQELKGVGTYGVIKNAAGFIVGAVGPGPKNLEDFGYLMERAILCATDLDLGTCWLGGSFTKSGFAKKIAATATEIVPAVASIGYVAETGKAEDWIRRRADGEHRLPAEQLFFEESFGNPIRAEDIGAAAVALFGVGVLLDGSWLRAHGWRTLLRAACAALMPVFQVRFVVLISPKRTRARAVAVVEDASAAWTRTASGFCVPSTADGSHR